MMLQREKDAVTNYLEFGIVQFIKKFEAHIDPDKVGEFYSDAYELLNDVDETAQIAVDGNHLKHNPAKR